ncbi:transcription-repair coupling factor [Alphaproteobacteria bacterium]|nr:transcription-repair coupling factor [Alphaproteobacteria bacterium]
MKNINKVNLENDIWGAPDGVASLALLQIALAGKSFIYVARDDVRMTAMGDSLRRLSPDLRLLEFPAWECLPFDRLSPQGGLVGRRIETLAQLASDAGTRPRILLTTINAILQRVPPKTYFTDSSLVITAGQATKDLTNGQTLGPAALADYLAGQAYLRTDTVRETGEFAVRGGILDVFPPGQTTPARLDFFGDDVETIRSFDPATQRSIGKLENLILRPVAEFMMNEATIAQFRTSYLSLFGAKASRDALYESVSAGRSHPGIEHWLPLFHDNLACLTDYCSGWPIVLDHESDAAITARYAQIHDFHEARLAHGSDDTASPYRPLAPEKLYLSQTETDHLFEQGRACRLFAFAPMQVAGQDSGQDSGQDGGQDGAKDLAKPDQPQMQDAGGRAAIRLIKVEGNSAVPELAGFVTAERSAAKRPIIVACSSPGAASRLADLLDGHLGAGALQPLTAIEDAASGGFYVMQWPLETGFQTDHLVVVSEPDIFGQRLSRPQSKRAKGDDFLREVSVLETGDLVVHAEHGIGRYEGLIIINSAGGDHDCLHLVYSGGDKLYLPVENIELLSRYGSAGGEAQLDKLGGVAWQARVARIKGRVRIMAEQLIKIAAARYRARAEPLIAEDGSFGEFCARFAFTETEDQLNAINDVVDDLASGKASDRLICGDVGFGKTEVALRAAFIAAMAGYQVALVAPTTLLARQHGKVFVERFAGFPIKIGVLSRMTSTADAKIIRENIASGEVQIAIGTHALLAKSITFNHLGLLIIDEEQHFGVGQKERLKELRGDIHVLTLSATPIPRTLQMALSGVREMSLIATPPVDRLAVRTFVGPWDGVVLREAIQREMFRGGQVFVVCPRIDDMQRVYDRITKLAPEARVISAHGRMPANELDQVMTRFADGEADILLSTNIVESGIDIPSANTMIIHRADMFGLSQLYQLRGRVGRGRQRAYAYLTSDPQRLLSPQARRRLEVMQTLDTLGAGFTLASYDMDIRGAGNLLGDEQSGHVREVGVELYQEMLRQAVDAAKSGRGGESEEDAKPAWTPQINLGLEIRLPESYVPDLTVRLSLYRRIADLADPQATDILIAELVDRFGGLPDPVKNLFSVIELKQLCRLANIEKIDAGPKGLSLAFRDNHFARPDALIGWIAGQGGRVQLRADHRLVVATPIPKPEMQPAACKTVLQDLVALL